MHICFGERNLKVGDDLEDPGLDGKIILKCIFEKWDGGMDFIDLAQDRDSLWNPLNASINLRVL